MVREAGVPVGYLATDCIRNEGRMECFLIMVTCECIDTVHIDLLRGAVRSKGRLVLRSGFT